MFTGTVSLPNLWLSYVIHTKKRHWFVSSILPFAEAIKQWWKEHNPSQNAQGRSRPTNEQGCPQFIPKKRQTSYSQAFCVTSKWSPNDLMSQHLFGFKLNDEEHTFVPQTRDQKIQTWSCGHTASRPSKSRDLQLQKFGLSEKSFNSSNQHSTDTGDSKKRLHTSDKILNSRKACKPGFELITSSDFGTLHSHQSAGSCKETKTHSWDHQSSAHLDITFKKIKHI